MNKQLLVAGGGIGGMAMALAAARQGWAVRLYEQADEFGEIGAGVQLGPNVTRILSRWGLLSDLERVAAFPDRITAYDAQNGQRLASLPLGRRCVERYGAPYATIHRAALHGVLLRAVLKEETVWLNLGHAICGYSEQSTAVGLIVETESESRTAKKERCRTLVEGDVLVGADGLWSCIRRQMLSDGEPVATGHVAYRGLLSPRDLPASLRTNEVGVWLAPSLHAVVYPVSGGERFNLVVIVEGALPAGDVRAWEHATTVEHLQTHMLPWAHPLRTLVDAVPEWRMWPLFDREPMQGPREHAKGLVALLGDAAHPMRPYMAQGAGMAIEDAQALGELLRMADADVPVSNLLQHYALNRWKRNARVQAKSRRNGAIFHASGPVRWGRNFSMRLLGERLMDAPWLYGGEERSIR